MIDFEKYKIVLLGPISSGKTLLIHRFRSGDKPKNTFPTIGVEFTNKILDQKQIQLNFWDTGGQQKYRSLGKVHYRGADGIILVYDVCEQSSFKSIDYWIKEFKQALQQPNKVVIGLCGNKIDINGRRVQKSVGQKYAKQNNLIYYEISAKTGKNVQQMLKDYLDRLISKRSEKKIEGEQELKHLQKKFQFNKQTEQDNKKSKCC